MKVLTENEELLISDYLKKTNGLTAEKYSEYFEENQITPEVQFALMKKEAYEVHLSILKDDEPNHSILDSELNKAFINNELESLKNFIEKAKGMVGSFSNKDHNFPDSHKNRDEIIYINLLTGYYLKEGAWYTPKEVSKIYAKYILWKDYLENLDAAPDEKYKEGKIYLEGLSAKEIAMLLRYLYEEDKKLNKVQIENLLRNVDGQNSYGNIATYFNNTFKDEFNRVHHPKDDSPKAISDHEGRYVNVINKLKLIGNTKGLEKAEKEFCLFQERYL
ncbi:hypothetical protein [Flagellimonas marina]|uniref:Uncharacterized protein n=1 Tax=Flagellimonas marina TaxID=1775168 RepID=A0ABV8PJN4_9FLAO